MKIGSAVKIVKPCKCVAWSVCKKFFFNKKGKVNYSIDKDNIHVLIGKRSCYFKRSQLKEV